jgi:Transglycosylase SLT domain
MPFDPSEFNAPAAPAAVPSLAPQPTNPQDVEKLVRAHAVRLGVDPNLAAGVARTESSFNPAAKNPDTGAAGVMQLMPQTAKSLGVNNINDANENTEAGVRYLKQLLDKNKGDTRAALAEYGGYKTKDPTDYINKVMGISGNQGKLFDPSEFSNAPTKPIDYQQAALGGAFDPSNLQSKLTEAGQIAVDVGRTIRPYIPWAVGGVAAMVDPLLAPVLAPLAAGLARTGEQSGLVQSGQQSPEGAKQQIMDTMQSEVKGQLAGKGLEIVAPALARMIYARKAGINPQDPSQVEAIADMVDRKIPEDIGRQRKLNSLKKVENDGLNEIYDKWGDKQSGQQIPGLVRTGAAGQLAAQQGASYSPSVAVNKNTVAVKLANYLTSEPTMSIPDRKAVVDAYKNFVDAHPDQDISLNDVRKIMQNLSKKVSFADPEAVGKMQGQKIVHHFLGETAQEAIPDASDAAKFGEHREELRRLVNIEDLPGHQKPKGNLLNYNVAMPVAGAMVGGASGYYSHQDPWAAAARGAVAGGLVSSPPTIAHLLNSPWARQLAIGGAGAISQGQSQPQMNLSPEELEQIRRSLNAPQ